MLLPSTKTFSAVNCAATIIMLLLNGSTSAQVENWDAYLSRYGTKPGSVLVDMNLYNTAPDKRYPYLVITGPQANSCDKNGIPDKSEIPVLEEVLDATTVFLSGTTIRVLAGTFTYNCERLNYYYLKDTAGARNAILRMYNRNFKDYKFVINIKHDPQWRNYLTFLYPDDATLNWMENNKKITQLLQAGDSLKDRREITFAACFTSDTARVAFSSYLTGSGYTTLKTPNIKNDKTACCILFSRNTIVNIDTLNSYSAPLKAEIAKHNGIYNGWEAVKK